MTGKITSDTISVVVRGRIFTGWKSARIVSSINQLATQFVLSVTRELPGGVAYERIRPGDLVQVFVDGNLVVTGYVDKTPVSYDGSSTTMSIEGRSKCGVLVDSCCLISLGEKPVNATRGEWADVKGPGKSVAKVTAPAKPASQRVRVDVGAAIRAIVEPMGVKLVSDTYGYRCKDVTISKGMKCFDAIRKLIQENNLLATDNEAGDLVLLNMDSPEAGGGALVATLDGIGTNVLSGGCKFDYTQVYSAYEVYGQAKPPKDSKEPASVTNFGGKATSKVLGEQTKVLRIFESGNADQKKMQDRANYEMSSREGKAKTATYKVVGWRSDDGRLWQKGQTVKIKDELLGIEAGSDAETWIIGSVTFDMSAAGMSTTLEVAPLNAYGVAPDWGGAKNGTKAIGATRWEDVK